MAFEFPFLTTSLRGSRGGGGEKGRFLRGGMGRLSPQINLIEKSPDGEGVIEWEERGVTPDEPGQWGERKGRRAQKEGERESI